ncbi:MAG: hypothetical protein AB8H79_03815 [Myxococcota bacterium]
MNTLGKTLIAAPALATLCALFIATTPPAETMFQTGEAQSELELADDAETIITVQVEVDGLPALESRPDWVESTIVVTGSSARRSTLVRDHSDEDAEAVRLRDGLTLPLDLNARCPEEGLCTFDVPVRLDTRRDDAVTLTVQASIGILDWDYNPRSDHEDLIFSFDDLDVQVFVLDEVPLDD